MTEQQSPSVRRAMARPPRRRMTPVDLVAVHHARLTLATFHLAESMSKLRVAEAEGSGVYQLPVLEATLVDANGLAEFLTLRGNVDEAATALSNAIDAVAREYAEPK